MPTIYNDSYLYGNGYTPVPDKTRTNIVVVDPIADITPQSIAEVGAQTFKYDPFGEKTFFQSYQEYLEELKLGKIPEGYEYNFITGRLEEIPEQVSDPSPEPNPSPPDMSNIKKREELDKLTPSKTLPIPGPPAIPEPSFINREKEILGSDGFGPVQKVLLPKYGYNNEREIRPDYTRRIKGEKRFILDMVDSSGDSYAISLADNSKVSAIALTPAPESLTINSSKIISRYHTMTRWVEEHWGDEIDTITFAGGSYGLFEYYKDSEYMGEGLTEVNRRKTDPYKMLKEVARLYRSNGMIYHDSDTYDRSGSSTTPDAGDLFVGDPTNSYFIGNHPRKGLPKERLYIKLHYDYITCWGYIESFDIIEDESTPFRLKYSISFKSEKTIYNQGITARERVDVNIPSEQITQSLGGIAVRSPQETSKSSGDTA